MYGCSIAHHWLLFVTGTGFVGGSAVERIGARLHAVRQKWGLTLREVEDRSVRLAEEWGNPSYRISASWLARVERDDRDLSAAKLIVLAVIFSIPADQLLALCPAGNGTPPQSSQVSSPKTTLLLTNGLLAEQARSCSGKKSSPNRFRKQLPFFPLRITCPAVIVTAFLGNGTTRLHP